MQGRLLPPVDGRIQAFPGKRWRDEFGLAQEVGLTCVEWIFETESHYENPLGTVLGVQQILDLSRSHDVRVSSVCADYYMENRLLDPAGTPRPTTVNHLAWLIAQSQRLGANHIVLPFVDTAALQSNAEIEGLKRILRSILPVAESHNVELHLETDLSAQQLRNLVQEMAHPFLRVNIDTGNSASLGHDPQEEIELLGQWLGSVHIKDRTLGGGTVELGKGDADLDLYFKLFKQLPYRGTFILQVARSVVGEEVQWARSNAAFVQARL